MEESKSHRDERIFGKPGKTTQKIVQRMIKTSPLLKGN